MRTYAACSAILIAVLTGNALAQIEPSSVKTSLRLTQTSSCDIMNNCEGSGKLSATASQTFDLETAVSDQFGPATEVRVESILLGSQTFLLGDDPNYEVGDESVKITKEITGPTEDITISLKMSWKNGVCKVAMKAKGTLASLMTATASSRIASLEPGNPANTGTMVVNIANGMTVLAESVGYFAVQVQQSVSQKPLPDNGVQSTTKISVKSKYQVSEPAPLPL